jgi:hypothetical protein
MATKVYAWPPVPTIGWEWDYVAPRSESFSALTGKRYASAAGPERRVAQLSVGALGTAVRGTEVFPAMGAGYVVMLKRLLDGGANLVRLTSKPINWYLSAEAERTTRSALGLEWADGAVDLLWDDVTTELLWYDGTLLTGVIGTSGIYDIVTVSGLPPLRLVARPGEYITAFLDSDDVVGSTAQVLAPAISQSDGTAIIRLFSPLAYGGRINIGISDTGVFRVAGELPRAIQSFNSDWSYGWKFEEVFSDEVGGFTEVTGWWRPTGPSS